MSTAQAVETSPRNETSGHQKAGLRWPGWATSALIFAALAAYPLIYFDGVDLGTRVLYYAIAAMGWNVLGGYTGQVSFGHALYFGVGAYITVMLVVAGWSPWLGIAASLPVAALIALVTGFPVLGLRGHYFSIATIAVAEIGLLLVQQSERLHKAAGFLVPRSERSLANLRFDPRDPRPYYYVALGFLALTALVVWLFLRGKAGSYVRAIRDDQQAAAAVGIPVRRYKLYSAMLSAAITALAGGFMVMYVRFVDPENGFGLELSVAFTLMAVLGGVGRFWGPLLGAWVLLLVNDTTRQALSGSGQSLDLVIFGALVVVVAVVEPGGLLAIAERIRNAVVRRLGNLRRSGTGAS
jgi:branched-chain amino acid transport system permease protein